MDVIDKHEPTGFYDYLPKMKKTRRASRPNRIGPLKKGLLKKTGYSVTAKTSARHKAVDRAVKRYGKLSTLRKLNAVAVYTRRRSPAKSRAFKSDVRYIQKKHY
jgi:hypothetical protein